MSITLNSAAPALTAVKSEQGDGHFYGYDATRGWFPLYKDDGEFRITEARAIHAAGGIAMPSATGYIDCMRKYQVEEYNRRNAAKAGRDMPMTADYADEDEWLDAVLARASTASHGARDKGSQIHKAFEQCHNGEDYDAAMQPYVAGLNAKITELGLGGFLSEVCVGSLELGVGGKADIIHESSMTIGDVKSRGHKLNKKKISRVPSYETDVIQCALYGVCRWGSIFLDKGKVVILATSTVIPGLVTPHTFTGKDIKDAHEAGVALTVLWRYTHKMDPRKAA